MTGRVFVLAVDSSRAAHRAASWCCNTLAQPGDELHVLVVTTSAAFGSSITPLASTRAHSSLGAEALATTKAVHEVLHLASNKVKEEQFKIAALRAPPGSRGVAKTIAAYANLHQANLIVLGSRGLGDFSRSLLAFVGQGSVCSLVLRDALSPVAIVRGSGLQCKGERHVLLLVEGTTTSGALQWALGVAVRPQDHLHVFTVGRPTAKLTELATEQLPVEHVHVEEGPAPHEQHALICQAVIQYASAQGIGLAVLPHQEQQGVAAALHRLTGLGGSLTDRLLRQLDCPVVVLRD